MLKLKNPCLRMCVASGWVTQYSSCSLACRFASISSTQLERAGAAARGEGPLLLLVALSVLSVARAPSLAKAYIQLIFDATAFSCTALSCAASASADLTVGQEVLWTQYVPGVLKFYAWQWHSICTMCWLPRWACLALPNRMTSNS